VHRDFYEDQLVEGPGGLGVLDLDDAALSEPAVDVANLVAHLQLIGIRSHAPGPQAVSRAFHSRYGALDSELDPRLVSLLVGATLLRLAEIHVMRAGADVARELLLRGDRALRALEDEVD
jgi:Ser/Thr protein kinase RdoA (MazF antagonist)